MTLKYILNNLYILDYYYSFRPLGRLRHRWEDNIKMYLREVGWGDMDLIYLLQDKDQLRALVNTVVNL
jgi:hypothetical protein